MLRPRFPHRAARTSVAAILVASAMCGAVACSGGPSPATSSTAAPGADATTAAGGATSGDAAALTPWSATAAAGGTVRVTPATARRGVTSDLGGQQLELVGSGAAIDRSWVSASGATSSPLGRWEIKEPDKFKLKSPQGQTLWKVKTDSGKFKILEGEEQVRYEIRAKSGGAEVVRADGQILATVTPGGSGAAIRSPGGGVLYGITGPYSPGYGVLVCTDIPLADRLVLFAELPTALGR